MGTSRKVTESQLEKAKAALSARADALKSKGVEAKKLKLDPKWRELDGKVRQINARLRKVGELEAIVVDLAAHKVKRQELLAQKQAERKAGLKKKARNEKKPKAKSKVTGGAPAAQAASKGDKGAAKKK